MGTAAPPARRPGRCRHHRLLCARRGVRPRAHRDQRHRPGRHGQAGHRPLPGRPAARQRGRDEPAALAGRRADARPRHLRPAALRRPDQPDGGLQRGGDDHRDRRAAGHHVRLLRRPDRHRDQPLHGRHDVLP
nr:hypothetical protein [Kitasatospora mediocidica]